MNCAENGLMTRVGGEFVRMTNEDVKYEFPFLNENGTIVTNPTNFTVVFYIENRTGSAACYRNGSAKPINCKIGVDGWVTFFLPKNTFNEGWLMCETKWVIIDADFPGGTRTIRGKYSTGVKYVQGEGMIA